MALSVTVVTAAFGCGRSVRKWADAWTGAGARCVVTDNGGGLSGDMFPGVLLLPFTGNTGFGGGINRAVEASRSDIVLITNPDTLPGGTDSLEKLAAFHSKNTLSGGATLDGRGGQAPSSGVWPDLPWVRKQLLKPAGTLWRKSCRDWLQGSLIMVSREDFLALGGFDSGYPLYFEDVDLCARAIKAGMTIAYNEDSVFVHNEGTGSSGSSAVRLAGFHWGMVQFFRNHRREDYSSVRKLVLLKCLMRAVLLPVSPGRASGYMAGLKAILRGAPPVLPERANG